MAKIFLKEVNTGSAPSMVNFVVNSAPNEVKAAIRRYNGTDVSRYTNKQVANLILKWFGEGYNVSQFLNVKYYGQVVVDGSQVEKYQVQIMDMLRRVNGDSMGRDNASLCEFPPCPDFVYDSNGQSFVEILGSITDFLNAAFPIGQLFLGTNQTGTEPPPQSAPSTSTQLNEWLRNNTTLVTGFIVVVIIGGILYIFRRRIFKRGTVIPKIAA